MLTLQQVAQADPQWTLQQLVETANQLLPQFLPQQESIQRIQEEVNPRLIRHYTTLGLLDKPSKVGREARYTYRHLLQLLVVRRLQMEGYSATNLAQLMLSRSNADLEALLQGGVQLAVQAANPALAYLQSIQQRSTEVPTLPQVTATSDAATAPAPPLHWQRFEVVPGLELHVREDFLPPGTIREQDNLLQLIGRIFHQLLTQRKPK